jgi:hypothetical protein
VLALAAALRAPTKAQRALKEADDAAARASTPAQFHEAGERYRRLAKDFPGTREAAQVGERLQRLDRRIADAAEAADVAALRALDASTPAARALLEERVRAFVHRTPPPSPARADEAKSVLLDAHRRAVRARCGAFFDRIRRDEFWSLSAFFDPEAIKGVGERLAVNFMMTAKFSKLKQDGWRLDSHTIDDVLLDAERHRASVKVRLRLLKEGGGVQMLPQTQDWVLRKGEWYLVPEDKNKK